MADKEIWIIKYEDADVSDDIFVGDDAEKSARRAYENRRMNWNCHLFAPVERLASAEKDAWFNKFRPIIDAIGEISVQEAMDAIERSL